MLWINFRSKFLGPPCAPTTESCRLFVSLCLANVTLAMTERERCIWYSKKCLQESFFFLNTQYKEHPLLDVSSSFSRSSYSPNSFRAKPKSSLYTMFLDDFIDRDPRRHNNVDFRARNENFTRRYRMMTAYWSFFLVLSFAAKALWKIKHSLLITPVVVNTNGVNVACSTSITRRL